jgi:hypothetical protein
MDLLGSIIQNTDDLVPIIAISGGIVIAFLWIVLATVSETLKDASRERTKREIAAYIAEGTMTPEQGERILKADAPHKDSA